MLHIFSARSRWFFSCKVKDVKTTKDKLRDHTTLLHMIKLTKYNTETPNNLDSKQLFLIRLMQSLQNKICEKIRKIEELIMLETHLSINPHK